MAESARYNFPEKDDPRFGDKVVDMLRHLFDLAGKDIKNLKPISTPDGTKQVGDFWFDSSDGKIKVNTEAGIKTIKYE